MVSEASARKHRGRPRKVKVSDLEKVEQIEKVETPEEIEIEEHIETSDKDESVEKDDSIEKDEKVETLENVEKQVEKANGKIGLQCKVGNPNCGLEMGQSLALGPIGVMPCDVCCSEPDFCRECVCILCGRAMKCGFSAFTSVRCCSRLSGAEFCGHAAHLMCALECRMAGVVKQLGLNMEYVCRRCDQKTDLREHVVRLLDSLRFTNCRFSAESNIGTALRIVQGTEDDGAKRLVYLLQNALRMMSKGAEIREVFDLLNGTQPEPLLD